MLKLLRPAIVSLLLFTVLTGVLYPAVITGLAQLLFPHQANGNVIELDGRPVGSSLIGQSFDDPKYFWGRLSGTGPVPYTTFNSDKGTGSSGTNYGPLNPALIDAAKARIDALRAADPSAPPHVPVDLVTASGSGLDPHISPDAAEYQVRRVARARVLDESAVRKVVQEHTSGRSLGLLGESRVNVLELNLALDHLDSGSR